MFHHRALYVALLSGCLALLLVSCSETSGTAVATVETTGTASHETITASGTSTIPRAPLKTVTTMSILADLVTQVGGDRVEAKNIIPVGAAAESYAPTPRDVREIAQADVIFLNGHGLEGWLDKLLTSAAQPNVPQVELSKDLPALDVGDDDFKQGNPHFWLNPHYAMHYVEVIRDTLVNVDPEGSPAYHANAASYLERLVALDRELEALASQIPAADRKMVTDHDAFPYFAERYGFMIVGSILGNADAELSAGELAELTRKIEEQQVKAIFTESQFSPKVAEAFAQDVGVRVVATLYTDSLSDGDEAATYIDMMRYNMRTIVQALTGKPAQ